MEHSIYPCLWFDGQAQQAAEFYVSVFRQSAVLRSTPMATSFEIEGLQFMALNGGPLYRTSMANSFYVLCGSEVETERLYEQLSQNGHITTPLGSYEWSHKYALVTDRFGVVWHLDATEPHAGQKIIPCLLFVNQKKTWVKDAMTHYLSIFPGSHKLLEAAYPLGSPAPVEGALLFAQFKLAGCVFDAMSSILVHDFDFTPGVSYVVVCANQAEIDHYWAQLGAGGAYQMCGWLQDKFGVSWQIVPAELPPLMENAERGPRVVDALLKMQKIDLETLRQA